MRVDDSFKASGRTLLYANQQCHETVLTVLSIRDKEIDKKYITKYFVKYHASGNSCSRFIRARES